MVTLEFIPEKEDRELPEKASNPVLRYTSFQK